MKQKNLFCFLFLFFLGLPMAAQQERFVQVYLTPDHENYLYQKGERAILDVTVLRNNVPLRGAELRYELSEDMMEPFEKKTVKLSDGHGRIAMGTLKKAGFLRCRAWVKVDGKDYEGCTTVGFSPEALQPVTTEPDDFTAFWDNAIADARKNSLDAEMTLMEDKCTDKVAVYHVKFRNNNWASFMYGTLAMPKAEGTYPAVLKLPGAGVRAYQGDLTHAAKGFIVLELGIHGIPTNMTGDVYHHLYEGALKGYHSFNMDDRDRFYYKRVYTGCVRAIDFLYTLPQFNGRLGAWGGSQGGGLSIVIAGLDKRVQVLCAMYPAITDMAGYTANRAGGWPHTMKDKKFHKAEYINTLRYFDSVNFARHIAVPGFYTFGYNDMVCPPTTSYSVFNVVQAPKELLVMPPTGHYAYSEQSAKAWTWFMEKLNEGVPNLR